MSNQLRSMIKILHKYIFVLEIQNSITLETLGFIVHVIAHFAFKIFYILVNVATSICLKGH
jgi:hypothetical protein